VVDRAIRPKLLDEYIGQPQVRSQMEILSRRQSCAAMRSITC
jgi:Holliday junction resolvasome RuvABC ATP-dependent DNA helicase subunit